MTYVFTNRTGSITAFADFGEDYPVSCRGVEGYLTVLPRIYYTQLGALLRLEGAGPTHLYATWLYLAGREVPVTSDKPPGAFDVVLAQLQDPDPEAVPTKTPEELQLFFREVAESLGILSR